MKKLNQYLPFALFIAFFGLSILAYINSKPVSKNPRIYKIVKEYSPYYIEKTLGGLRIKSKVDKEFKEEPSNMEFFKRLEYLERSWAQNHLFIKDGKLFIVDDNKTTLKSVELKNKKEYNFLQQYYGIKSK